MGLDHIELQEYRDSSRTAPTPGETNLRALRQAQGQRPSTDGFRSSLYSVNEKAGLSATNRASTSNSTLHITGTIGLDMVAGSGADLAEVARRARECPKPRRANCPHCDRQIADFAHNESRAVHDRTGGMLALSRTDPPIPDRSAWRETRVRNHRDAAATSEPEPLGASRSIE